MVCNSSEHVQQKSNMFWLNQTLHAQTASTAPKEQVLQTQHKEQRACPTFKTQTTSQSIRPSAHQEALPVFLPSNVLLSFGYQIFRNLWEITFKKRSNIKIAIQ